MPRTDSGPVMLLSSVMYRQTNQAELAADMLRMAITLERLSRSWLRRKLYDRDLRRTGRRPTRIDVEMSNLAKRLATYMEQASTEVAAHLYQQIDSKDRNFIAGALMAYTEYRHEVDGCTCVTDYTVLARAFRYTG